MMNMSESFASKRDFVQVVPKAPNRRYSVIDVNNIVTEIETFPVPRGNTREGHQRLR